MISILVLTLNEENNLPACLETVKWSDDIHVLDSYSSDRTVEIAKEHGARVWFRKFDSFAQHQNWALENIPFEHPWVFYLDADERVTPDLADVMRKAVQDPGEEVAFRMHRRDFFLGTWLKHVQMTAFYDRLFRPGKMRYERLGHCISRPDGPVATLPGYLDHFPFSKGIGDWVQRHNFYSAQEAQQILLNRKSGTRLDLAALLLSTDVRERRRQLKELYYRMPFRPLIKFFYMYVIKVGFLDGRAGWTYCVLMGFYEFLIQAKTRELMQSGDSH
ncbi:MAG TPA: glycosyltransferase family 2 protein [Terracidiphilus sp.]|nr:glycosyltransferase family 2 protein [Terracidiphilus sp.]